MEIRKAKIEELDEIMEIFEHARQFMAKNGNASQWGTTYPEQEIVDEFEAVSAEMKQK